LLAEIEREREREREEKEAVRLLDAMRRRKNVYERKEEKRKCYIRKGRRRSRVSSFLGRLLICHASTLRPFGRPCKQK